MRNANKIPNLKPQKSKSNSNLNSSILNKSQISGVKLTSDHNINPLYPVQYLPTMQNYPAAYYNSYNVFNGLNGFNNNGNTAQNINPPFSLILRNIPSINDIQSVCQAFYQSKSLNPGYAQQITQQSTQFLDNKSLRILFDDEQILGEFFGYLNYIKGQNKLFRNVKIEREGVRRRNESDLKNNKRKTRNLIVDYSSFNNNNNNNSFNNGFIDGSNNAFLECKNTSPNEVRRKNLSEVKLTNSVNGNMINDSTSINENPHYLYQKNKTKYVDVSEVLNLNHDYAYNFNGLKINPFSLKFLKD